MEDARNVPDFMKQMSVEEIVDALDSNAHSLEIAIENLERDFNMGSIVRTANAFGVRTVHVIGRKQWNKRGAMMTDKYLHVQYHKTIDEFTHATRGKRYIAVDNTEGSTPLHTTTLPPNAVLIFGSESNGISPELATICEIMVEIEQFGSTRSINVGHAAAVVMYEWVRQNVLEN